MINQYNSGGAVNDPLAGSKAYAKALGKYSPKGASNSAFGSIAGGAMGTIGKGMAANPKLAAQVGESLRKYFSDEQAPAPVEDKSTMWQDPEAPAEMPMDQMTLEQLLQQGQPNNFTPIPQQSLFGGTVPMQTGGGY